MQHAKGVTSLRLLSSDEPPEDDPDCSTRSDGLFTILTAPDDRDDQASAGDVGPPGPVRVNAGNPVKHDDGADRDDALDSLSTFLVSANADVMRPITFNDGRVHCCVRVRPSSDPIVECDLLQRIKQ
jgi:hypothetical protein